jgi:2OG-Fe(II) oxygenase superfamily
VRHDPGFHIVDFDAPFVGTTRTFRLREVIPESEKEERNAQTFNIPVTHNSLLIMHASCQERFKHAVPPQQTIDVFKPVFPPAALPSASIGTSGSRTLEMMAPETSRINITFRFYRPDFASKTIPRCHCGIPTILRPDMKRKNSVASDEQSAITRYFWMCYAGAQNDGKGCSFFQVLDMEKEGRGLNAVTASLALS